SAYGEGVKLAAAGKPGEAARQWRVSAQAAQESQPAWLRVWLLFRAATLLVDAHQWEESDKAYGEALEQAENTGPAVRAQLLQRWGQSYHYRGDWTHAEKYYQAALVEWRKANPESMAVPQSLYYLGWLAYERGEPAVAEEYYQQALTLQEKIQPS